jgi:3-methyladenine DNA glycosylase AlkD
MKSPKSKPKANDVIAELKKYQEPERVPVLSSFFKSGKGQYGEGDRFMGVSVPNMRIVAKKFTTLPLAEVETLLHSKIHEHRSCALAILVYQFEAIMKNKTLSEVQRKKSQKEIYDFYLSHTECVNNWDLVDGSAREIVGAYLFNHEKDHPSNRTSKIEGRAHTLRVLTKLAKSNTVPHALWERRIAMIATFYFIGKGEFEPTLQIGEILLGDKHDLMHKAVGWMLREMGKKDIVILHGFLEKHGKIMPRTALRYAIERMTPAERKRYMRKEKKGKKSAK